MLVCVLVIPFSQEFRDSLAHDDINIDILGHGVSNPVHVKLPPMEGTDPDSGSSIVTSSSSTSSSLDLTRFEQCSTAIPNVKASDSTSTYTTKPLWLTMIPFAIPESLHKSLINPLTGTTSGAKSFYASIKGQLKHCIGNGQSVTCSNVHPGVEMNKGMPDSLSNGYYSKYIMVIRNPMGYFPQSFNAKSAKYSGTVGQTPEEEWRKARDEWFENMWGEWKKTITTWRDTTKYDIGMYLVYEDLYDVNKGPEMMKQLRSLLMEAGFDVAPEEDLGCIWYNAVGKEDLERFHRLHYDYEDYIPGYTQEQKNYLLKEMEVMMKEFEGDSTLVEILGGYMKDIESKMRIDVASVVAVKS